LSHSIQIRLETNGWSHSELWHKIAPYSEIAAWHQLLQRWTITQVAVVADATVRRAQEDQTIKSLRPPLNRNYLSNGTGIWKTRVSLVFTGIKASKASAKHSKLDTHTSTRSRKIASERSTPLAKINLVTSPMGGSLEPAEALRVRRWRTPREVQRLVRVWNKWKLKLTIDGEHGSKV
jgi:hypothetical protein